MFAFEDLVLIPAYYIEDLFLCNLLIKLHVFKIEVSSRVGWKFMGFT